MMLNHLAETRNDASRTAAERIRTAYDERWLTGKRRAISAARSRDAFADAVIARL